MRQLNWDMCRGRAGHPNLYDSCLDFDAALWRGIQRRGGIGKLCMRVGYEKYDNPPWIVMPPQGRRYQEIATIVLPAPGVDTQVVAFTVPFGFDGVITGVVNRFIGAGFVEGSGDLLWRIQLSRRYAPDYGNIDTSLGDLTSPIAMDGGGMRIYSGQLVRYLTQVVNPATLDPAGRVLCAIYGWFYPRG